MDELCEACKTGDYDTVKRLATNSELVNTPHTKTGEYPLFLAALNHHKKIYKFLSKIGGAIATAILDDDHPKHKLQYYYVEGFECMLSGSHDDAIDYFDKIINCIKKLSQPSDFEIRLLAASYDRLSRIDILSDIPDDAISKANTALATLALLQHTTVQDHIAACRIHRRFGELIAAKWKTHEAEHEYSSAINALLQSSECTPAKIKQAYRTYLCWDDLYLSNSFGAHLCEFAAACFESSEIASETYFRQLYTELTCRYKKQMMLPFYPIMTQLMTILLQNYNQPQFPANQIRHFLSNPSNLDRFISALNKLKSEQQLTLSHLCEGSPATTIAVLRELRTIKQQINTLESSLSATHPAVKHSRQLPESFFQTHRGEKRTHEPEKEESSQQKFSRKE